ncbi:hypothetical protein D3C77_547520 [compost metagenome]
MKRREALQKLPYVIMIVLLDIPLHGVQLSFRLKKTLDIGIKGNEERHVLQILYIRFKGIVDLADKLQRVIRNLAIQNTIHRPVNEEPKADGRKNADEQKMNNQFIADRQVIER